MILSELLLHPKTADQIKNLVKDNPHVLMISAKKGSGKTTVARAIAAEVLSMSTDKLSNYPYFFTFNETTGIDDVRSIQKLFKLSVPSNKKVVNRVVIIENAETLRHEAQNALLKTLEEPPAKTLIILLCSNKDKLLSTVRSRVNEIELLPIALNSAVDFFVHSGSSSREIAKAYQISQGQVGLMSDLLNKKSTELTDSISLAKEILREGSSQRLERVDNLAKDKNKVRLLLDAILRIAHAGLVSAPNDKLSKQWHKIQTQTINSVDRMEHNPNIKLLLDNLFLSI